MIYLGAHQHISPYVEMASIHGFFSFIPKSDEILVLDVLKKYSLLHSLFCRP